MKTLKPWHQAKFITRCVLLWFVFSIGLSVFSPLAQPLGFTEVCSAAGSRWIVTDNGSQEGAVLHTINCVLCAPAVVPPPPAAQFPLVVVPHFSLLPDFAVHVAWQAAMFIAARAPPSIY